MSSSLTFFIFQRVVSRQIEYHDTPRLEQEDRGVERLLPTGSRDNSRRSTADDNVVEAISGYRACL
jgi:hypothetical protein